MRALLAPIVVLTLCGAVACAAKIPATGTFSPDQWSSVETIKPGARVEVVYVTGTPPLRHSFEGTFLSATAEVLEVATKDGRQRLLPNRVLRVAVGGRENRTLELGAAGFFAGAILGTLSIIDPPNDNVVKQRAYIGALMGGALGAALGARRGDARPRVVYERDKQ